MRFTTKREALQESLVEPIAVQRTDDGTLFVDFGKAAYGTLVLKLESPVETVAVHLGEKLGENGRIDREPGGTIRYQRIEQAVAPGETSLRLSIPHDERNTNVEQGAIRMPEAIGEVYPFRYAEIEDGDLVDSDSVRQVFVHYPFDEKAASFDSSSDVLNDIWALCKHTIKATTFCGIYVDGDRERIPYEGDAYINQLGHYYVGGEYRFARYSHEYMIQRPTWCTEWHLHSVMMAWMDLLYSGETASFENFFEELKAKTLLGFAREDSLISVDPQLRTPEMVERLEPLFRAGTVKRDIRDVLDWPPGSFTEGGAGERDNHEMMPINTVTNAFHCHALNLMATMCDIIGKDEERSFFESRAGKVARRINELLFDAERGIYIDGEGSLHASLHSNMFMLAFGLVPEDRKRTVLDFVMSRGMACSVYGAQHLLDALYLNGEADYALGLMTALHDRSWWNMIRSGSTMTMEAWDIRYKNNLDWNHAWGAAPGNIVGRWLLGVRPVAPGFTRVIIQPQPGSLERATGTVPTPLGPVTVAIENRQESPFKLSFVIPDGMTASAGIPAATESSRLLLNGMETAARRDGKHLFVDDLKAGGYTLGE